MGAEILFGGNRRYDTYIMNRRNPKYYYMALAAITAIGAALRVWGWAVGELTHDELSAIGRLDFDSFGDLIRGGVYPDGHPAGVQVLLWLWTGLFGDSTRVVRLPFLLMGIGCIPLMARVARLLTNRNAAIFAAAVTAASQYGVYFSMLARPYVAGLFCTLVMLCCWIPMVAKGAKSWRLTIGFAVSAAACAYCHQFAMLTALLTAIVGLALCRREVMGRYIAGCAAALLLFAPHIPVTWHQMTELQGVGGWLAAPDATFAREYVMYLFHFSPWLAAATIGWTVYESRWCRMAWRLRRRHMAVTALLWILPLAIGFGYSVWVNPVLQYSCLIFSWPMLILLASSLFGRGKRGSTAFAALWMAVAVTTLFATRHHDIHYRQIFESGCRTAWEYEDRYGRDKMMCWIEADSTKLAYYERHYGRRLHNAALQDLTASELDKLLDTTRAERIVATGCDLYKMEAIRRHFPYVERRTDLTRSTLWVLGRSESADSRTVARDTLMDRGVDFDAEEEFTPLADTSLGDLADSRSTILRVRIQFEGDDLESAPLIVMETLKGDQQADYQCEPMDKMDGTLVRDMAEVVKRNRDLGSYRIKIYLWNPDHASGITPTRFTLSREAGNPNEFGVEERITPYTERHASPRRSRKRPAKS